MRSGNLGTGAYAPGQVPTVGEALPAFLTAELAKIAAAVQLLALGHFDTSYAAPAKPREGDLRLADGTRWDPGAGAGVYAYYAGSWKKLG
jgi:hypothetical protein